MKRDFLEGFRDGIPIGLGYLAVGFSVGIACRAVGLSPFQGLLISFLNNASAGEYAGLTVIAAQAGLLEMAIITFIVNARYMLMSCALSQRVSPKTSMFHRMIMGFAVTDEIFGVAIAQPNYVSPYYYFGVMCIAIPGWSSGTVLGIILGNLLPLRLVSAFSVALFGMFLAVIVPPAKKDKVVLGCVLLSFIASFGFENLPVVSELSAGTRTIILTVVISAAAAILFPRRQEDSAS